jgi:hypothetical protein
MQSLKVQRAILATLFLTGLTASEIALSSTIIAAGTTPYGIDTVGAAASGGTPDTIQFLAEGPDSVSAPGTFSQGLQVVSGYDGVGALVPFTVNENITVDGMTESVAISGTMNVSTTTAPDTITINTGTPITFGSVSLTVVGQTFNDVPPYNNPPGAQGVYNGEQTFDVTPVPLPASSLLLLSGLAGAGFVARRRKFLG